MDIIVTTPKSEMANAAREAEECQQHGGGYYFRRFPPKCRPTGIQEGSRVWYVEDGFIRGYALVDHLSTESRGKICGTTGNVWPAGFYLFMRADSWRWIRPIKMKGFQGFRYAGGYAGGPWPDLRAVAIEEGGWRDPRPRSCRVCGCTDRHGCVPPKGPCSWVEDDLCSACVGTDYFEDEV